jgi:hypothetical protein
MYASMQCFSLTDDTRMKFTLITMHFSDPLLNIIVTVDTNYVKCAKNSKKIFVSINVLFKNERQQVKRHTYDKTG